jgi:hypothetical protein
MDERTKEHTESARVTFDCILNKVLVPCRTKMTYCTLGSDRRYFGVV